MNKSEQAQVKAKDVFSAYKSAVDKTFESINQSVPRYHQSIANTQQEALKAVESNVASAIQVQKAFASKAGIPTTMSDAGLKAFKDTADGYIKMAGIGNQIALATLDAAQQGIKNLNENIQAYNDLSQTTVQSWIAAFGVTN